MNGMSGRGGYRRFVHFLQMEDLGKFKLLFWPNHEYRKITSEFKAKIHRIVEHVLTAINYAEPQQCPQLLLIGPDAEEQRLGQEEFDARIEYSFKLVPINGQLLDEADQTTINDQRMEIINGIIGRVQQEIGDGQFTCSLMLTTKEFFAVDYNSACLQIATESCSFLNMIDRSQPFCHRTVQITTDPHRSLSRVYGQPVRYPMLTDFEHDRRQLTFRFPYFGTERQSYGGYVQVNYVVSLTVRYGQIKRIMANVQKDDKQQNKLDLYLHLSSPPIIRRMKLFDEDPKKLPSCANLLTVPGSRFTAWDLRKTGINADPYLCAEVSESPIFRLRLFGLKNKECCQLLNRLAATTDRCIEFKTFTEEKAFPFNNYKQSPLDNEECKRICENNFELLYMISAVFSRGSVVKDYLLVTEAMRNEFIGRCAEDYRMDRALTLEVLEQLLAEIDKRLDCLPPLKLYAWLHARQSRDVDRMRQIHADRASEGYVRVRKVIITPTRMLFVAPELLMGNRVLRFDSVNYPVDRFLRLVFRDDDMGSVHATSVGPKLIDKFVGKALGDGINIAGNCFNYFGSSNSQMRDNGCYFINASVDEITQIRQSLGRFEMQCAPKMMSRIAQCFTQARETSLLSERKYYGTVFDYKGGRDSNDEPYNFSDGVGKISVRTARVLSQELGLEGCIPSCFQFRFRGYKGILAVDPSLDAVRDWGERNGLEDRTNWLKRDCWLDLHVQFRPSQKKFRVQRANQKLEIVKHSCPVPICLNRPVINILDQVSGLQSQASHERICNRIHWLMDLHLNTLTRSLIDEKKARDRLGEFPKMILYDRITDIMMTTEPFFRSMIRASVRCSLKRLRTKLQMPIPTNMGRSMFGVADDSGQLQYGEVFIRYTKNVSVKLPNENVKRAVLKGPVMITKNPTIVAGDIRMFMAIDIPALHHLSDVVVFPRYGARPHSDEMAGSDLDGDEYMVIWDDQLYLDRNEDAFDYTCKADKLDDIEDESELRAAMIDFYVDYVKQDSIGQIANAFLMNSDLYGIKSEVCNRIARKHTTAVDFPKTGKPPAPLTRKWESAEEETEDQPATEAVPPERAERIPDFMEKNHEPTYMSTRLNGQLYRRAKQIDDILTLATQDDGVNEAEMDELITWPGCDDRSLMELAQKHYESYAAHIQSILDCYGIKTEGELFSGHYANIRNRISEKDLDDMSFYNTTNAIEQQLFSVFSRFRRQFFETPFSGRVYRYEEVTTPVRRLAGGIKDVSKRICTDPTDDYKRMACAYYKFAYDPTARRLLSFPWLAWEVINVVRRTNAMKKLEPKKRYTFDPLSDKLTEHIREYVDHRRKQLKELKEIIRNPENAPESERTAWSSIKRYCARYDEMVVDFDEWGEHQGGEGPLTQLHVCILLIQFGLNYLPCEQIESQPSWLEQIPTDEAVTEDSRIYLERQHGGLGKKFLMFLEFLASRQFQLLPWVDFSEPDIGFQSILRREHLDVIHRYAIQAYHEVAFTFRFERLPCRENQLVCFNGTSPPNRQVAETEGEAFIIEVPVSRQYQVEDNPHLVICLADATGCRNIVFRAIPRKYRVSETLRLWVSATGTAQSLNKLRELLSVTAPLNLTGDCRPIFTHMAEQLYDRLVHL